MDSVSERRVAVDGVKTHPARRFCNIKKNNKAVFIEVGVYKRCDAVYSCY